MLLLFFTSSLLLLHCSFLLFPHPPFVPTCSLRGSAFLFLQDYECLQATLDELARQKVESDVKWEKEVASLRLSIERESQARPGQTGMQMAGDDDVGVVVMVDVG